jgi:hypothetical protein
MHGSRAGRRSALIATAGGLSEPRAGAGLAMSAHYTISSPSSSPSHIVDARGMHFDENEPGCGESYVDDMERRIGA